MIDVAILVDCEMEPMSVIAANLVLSTIQWANRTLRMLAATALTIAMLAAVASITSAEEAVSTPKTVAFLGVRLQNDNEELDPTSDAEKARQMKLEALFKQKIEATGRFKFVPTPPEVMAKIVSGQNMGDCNGCEVDFGKQLGGERVAWVVVQKISNLILNMNVYMADTATNKLTYIHSVDIRGNTDESWLRSMTYMMDNYFDGN